MGGASRSASRSGGVDPVPEPAPDIPKDMRSIESKMISAWDDHGYYTGLVFLAKVNKLPNDAINALKTRLLQNQNHIAQLFKPKFNEKVATDVAKALQEHIVIADKLIDALMNGDTMADTLTKDWKRNADEIGTTLYKLQNRYGGPYILSEGQWKSQMQEHLTHLTKIISQYLKGDRADALKDMDPYIEHIRRLAMALAKLVSGPRMPFLLPAAFGPVPPYAAMMPSYYAYRPLESEIITPPSPFYPKASAQLPQAPYRFRTQTVYYP